MSMLAGPRRKQKYSSDPRGLIWSNDDSKFGQKLMEKMGWQKGKGLGAQEDGRLEHIAVNVKEDNGGVGCKKNHADNWIAHQEDFNSLLSQLNECQNSETETHLQDLEEKSKQTKARVHYQKFIKGKDLSNAKQNDLASIFGKRKNSSSSSTPQNQSEVNYEDEEHTNGSSNEAKTTEMFGITVVHNGTSITDYFAKKMAQIKAKAAGSANTNNTSPVETKPEQSGNNAKNENVVALTEDSLDVAPVETSQESTKTSDGEASLKDHGESELECEQRKTRRKKRKRKHSSSSETAEAETGGVRESKENVHKKKKSKRASPSPKLGVGSDEVNEDGRKAHKKKKCKRRHCSPSPKIGVELDGWNENRQSAHRKKRRRSSLCPDIECDSSDQNVEKGAKKRLTGASYWSGSESDKNGKIRVNEREKPLDSEPLHDQENCGSDRKKKRKLEAIQTEVLHVPDDPRENEQNKNSGSDHCSSGKSDDDDDVGGDAERETRKKNRKTVGVKREDMTLCGEDSQSDETAANVDDKKQLKSGCERETDSRMQINVVECQVKECNRKDEKRLRKKSLLQRNFGKLVTGLFPGSNLCDIQGYGCSR